MDKARAQKLLADGLERVCEWATEELGADRCWVVRREGDVLRTVAGIGMVLAAPTQAPLPLDKGIVGRVARSGGVARIDDVLKDPDYFAATALTRSELAAPLRANGSIVGVLNFEANRVGAFSDGDEAFVAELAALIGSTLGA